MNVKIVVHHIFLLTLQINTNSVFLDNPNCKIYDTLTWNCLECYEPYFFEKGTCVSECSSQYGIDNESLKYECKPCKKLLLS